MHLRNGYMRAYAQIKQHSYTHNAVDMHVKAKSYSLVEGNQTIDCYGVVIVSTTELMDSVVTSLPTVVKGDYTITV